MWYSRIASAAWNRRFGQSDASCSVNSASAPASASCLRIFRTAAVGASVCVTMTRPSR